MKTIWKYVLSGEDEQIIELPEGSENLCIQVQYDKPCIWFKVDPNKRKLKLKILTRGTGHPLTGKEGIYLGTYLLENGALVFHVFSDKGGE